MSAEVGCPHCTGGAAKETEQPFTYFELVPRWQRVRRERGRLIVSAHTSYGDEGDQSFLLCNGCDQALNELPPLVFEGRALHYYTCPSRGMLMTASSLESVIAKIKALRALATSSNVHEAAAAAARAEALLQKHRLDEAALEATSAPVESAGEETEPLAWHSQHLSWWRVTLGAALLRAHGCVGYVDTRAGRRCQVIVGRPSDVATVRYLYAWLTTEICRLTEAHGRGKGRSWRNSFCLGAVTAIRDAMRAAAVDARREAASTALAVLDRRAEESKSLLAKLRPDLRSTRGGAASDRGAFARGVEAGRAIHLGGSLAGGGQTRVLGSGERA